MSASGAARRVASVIIPAHNEEGQIANSLNALAEVADQLDVVVVCNGCTDHTAEVSRSVAPWARVEEIVEASKTAALNRGDAVAEVWPRLYLDADVAMTGPDVLRLVDELVASGAEAAAPRCHVDAAQSPWLVRAYYDVWSQLCMPPGTLAGPGAYCLTRQGRQRFTTFPRVVADDQFVQSQFGPGARITVEATTVTHRAPRSVGSLVARLVRVHAGNKQLAQRGLALQPMPRTGLRGLLGLARRKPRMAADVVAYGMLAAYVHLRAHLRLRLGDANAWGRDDSSRVPVAAGTLD
jgi:hypothetical protein